MDLLNLFKHIFERTIPREEKNSEFLQVKMEFTLTFGNGKISITPYKTPDYQAEYVAPLKAYLDLLQGKTSTHDLKSSLKIRRKIGGVNIDRVLNLLKSSAQQDNEIQSLLSQYREKYKI
ncbi:MAG: hypothetical protein ACTSSA_15555 [Candidatus Freyarchaeota archaeon]